MEKKKEIEIVKPYFDDLSIFSDVNKIMNLCTSYIVNVFERRHQDQQAFFFFQAIGAAEGNVRSSIGVQVQAIRTLICPGIQSF